MSRNIQILNDLLLDLLLRFIDPRLYKPISRQRIDAALKAVSDIEEKLIEVQAMRPRRKGG